MLKSPTEDRLTLRIGVASLLFATLLPSHVTAQTSTRLRSLFNKSPVDRIVDQLVENASSFRATLPSITAHETIESDASDGWLIKRHVKAEATMRVLRKTPGGPLEESREITVIDGKPVKPGKHIDLPTNLLGGFGSLSNFFFTSTNRHCFNYSLVPRENPDGVLELQITLSPDAASLANCPMEWARFNAVALVNSESHQLMRLEWSIPNEDAVPFHRWPFASVDLAPVAVGDKTFWLPTTVIGRSINGKARADWVSHYSDYHRFTAIVNILPASP